jgi:hypothetical protein
VTSIAAILGLLLALAALKAAWRRRVYRCRCHGVRVGGRRDRAVHGEDRDPDGPVRVWP